MSRATDRALVAPARSQQGLLTGADTERLLGRPDARAHCLAGGLWQEPLPGVLGCGRARRRHQPDRERRDAVGGTVHAEPLQRRTPGGLVGTGLGRRLAEHELWEPGAQPAWPAGLPQPTASRGVPVRWLPPLDARRPDDRRPCGRVPAQASRSGPAQCDPPGADHRCPGQGDGLSPARATWRGDGQLWTPERKAQLEDLLHVIVVTVVPAGVERQHKVAGRDRHVFARLDGRHTGAAPGVRGRWPAVLLGRRPDRAGPGQGPAPDVDGLDHRPVPGRCAQRHGPGTPRPAPHHQRGRTETIRRLISRFPPAPEPSRACACVCAVRTGVPRCSRTGVRPTGWTPTPAPGLGRCSGLSGRPPSCGRTPRAWGGCGSGGHGSARYGSGGGVLTAVEGVPDALVRRRRVHRPGRRRLV